MSYTCAPAVFLGLTLYETLYLSLVFATLVVGVISLSQIFQYVRDTAAISKAALGQAEAANRTSQAAIEQAEASQKPWLVIEVIPREAIDAIMDSPYGMKLPPGDVTFRNIGPGPAMNIMIVSEELEEGKWKRGLGYAFPHVLPGGTLPYPEPSQGMPNEHKFHAMYQSMSGTRYVTHARFENRILREIEVRQAQKDEKLPQRQLSPKEIVLQQKRHRGDSQ